jgi:hypothetical protein
MQLKHLITEARTKLERTENEESRSVIKKIIMARTELPLPIKNQSFSYKWAIKVLKCIHKSGK